jgi:hypothetical protein
MIYKAEAIYKATITVDTKSQSFKQFKKRESRWHPNYTDEQFVEDYAAQQLDWDITDDNGNGTLSADSMTWTIVREK